MKGVTIPFEGELLIFQVSEDNLAEVLSPRNTLPILDLEGVFADSLANLRWASGKSCPECRRESS